MSDDQKDTHEKTPYSALTAGNVAWHHHPPSGLAPRAASSGPTPPPYRPCVLWCTGLSGSGKSTLAGAVAAALAAAGVPSYVLDGDNVRHGLCADLGFAPPDRTENIRRVGEVAALLVDAGLVVCTAFVSPYREDREGAREILRRLEARGGGGGGGNGDGGGAGDGGRGGIFVEVFCDADLAACEGRDVKGLYKMAREGKIKDFTGIGSPYEAPENPEIRIDTGGGSSVTECVSSVMEHLKGAGLIGGPAKDKP